MSAKNRIHVYCDAGYFDEPRRCMVIGAVFLDASRSTVVRAEFAQHQNFPTVAEDSMDPEARLNHIMARGELMAVRMALELGIHFGFQDMHIYCDHLLADRRYKDSAAGQTLKAFLDTTSESIPDLKVVKVDGRSGCIPHNICDAYITSHGRNGHLWKISKERMRELVQESLAYALTNQYQLPDANPDKKGIYRDHVRMKTTEEVRQMVERQQLEKQRGYPVPPITAGSIPSKAFGIGGLNIPENLVLQIEDAVPKSPPPLPTTTSSSTAVTPAPFSSLVARPKANEFLIKMMASASYGDWVPLPGGDREFVHVESEGTLRFSFVHHSDKIHISAKTCKCADTSVHAFTITAPERPTMINLRNAIRIAFRDEARDAGYPFQDWEIQELVVATETWSGHDAVDVTSAEEAWKGYARRLGLHGRKHERHRHTFMSGFLAATEIVEKVS